MTATIAHLESGTKLDTSIDIGVHLNADTVMDCVKKVRADGTEYFVAKFSSPGQGYGGLKLFLSEEDMLRLWFVFESARRSEPGQMA